MFLYVLGRSVLIKYMFRQDGWTPLYYAVGNNYIDIVKLLLEKKADVNVANIVSNITLCACCCI